MEKLLLKHMWKIAFFFWSIVFISWVLQYINLPVWWFVQNLFWITEIKNTISTQYMFTTIWAIFAFWYWYKKYERDKELQNLEHLSSDNYQLNILEQTGKLELLYNYYNNGLLSKNIWSYIEKNFWNNILYNINSYVQNWLSQIKQEQLELNNSLNLLKSKINFIKENNDYSKESVTPIEQELIMMHCKSKELEDKTKVIQNTLTTELNKCLVDLFNSNNTNYIEYLKIKLNEIDTSSWDTTAHKIINSIKQHLETR